MLLNLLLLQVAFFLACFHCEDKIDNSLLLKCDPTLCPSNTKHIGCVDHNKVSENCGKGKFTLVPITAPMALHIVEHVNTVRNMVASGYLPLGAAVRMPAMAWSHELAFGASLLARQCDLVGLFCANTPKYNYVVTATMSTVLEPGSSATKAMISHLLLVWLNDIMGCRMDESNDIHPIADGLCVGHYLSIIQDKGNRMGCALRQIDEEGKKPDLSLICLISRANVNGQPPYEVGLVPAEKCVTGTNVIYPYLCSQDEQINNNELPTVHSRAERVARPGTCENLRRFYKDNILDPY